MSKKKEEKKQIKAKKLSEKALKKIKGGRTSPSPGCRGATGGRSGCPGACRMGNCNGPCGSNGGGGGGGGTRNRAAGGRGRTRI